MIDVIELCVITVVGDTHGRGSDRLVDDVFQAITNADIVVHTGDFLTQTVLDSFESNACKLIAVHGNNDSREVRERLPEMEVFSALGLTIVLVHGHHHSHTSLEYLGREHGADLVIFGHSHSPQVNDSGEVVLLNPGSHTEPRQFRPGYAQLFREDGIVVGRLFEPSRGRVDEFQLVPKEA